MRLFKRLYGDSWLLVCLLALTSQSARAELLCQGAGMVLSCGNLVCDKWTGENAETCPSDCASYAAASYNFQQVCEKSQALVIPETTDQLQSAMLASIQGGRHVKIVGRLHSTNSVICNEGVLISTQKLDKVLGLETYNGVETVRVQSGITIGELSDWLHEQGKSLGYALMGFRGISIGGAIGTGAHGSSPKHISVLPAFTESLKVLGADGKITEYNRIDTNPETWKALNTHLGLLGVILEVRLRVSPQFALKTSVDFKDEAELLDQGPSWNLIKDCDFGQLVWFPGAKRVMRTCAQEQSLAVAKMDKGARASFVDFDLSNWLFPIAKAFVHSGSCNKGSDCLFERIRVGDLERNPPLKVMDGTKEKRVFTATGYSHKMMASDLGKHTANFYQNDWAVALPLSRLDDALRAMREKFDLYKMCLPFAGIFIRYGQAHDISLMAHSVPGAAFEKDEVVVFLDMVVYNPVGLTAAQRAEHEIPQGEIIKMLVERFGARLHWGKNKDWAFALEMQRGILGDNLNSFRAVAQELDPYGIFANPTGDLLNIAWPRKGEDFTEEFQPIAR